MCRYQKISLRNKVKKEMWARGWAKGDRKIFEKGGVIKEPSWNRWIRNLYVTYELFDSNQFNKDNIKVIRNYDHGDNYLNDKIMLFQMLLKMKTYGPTNLPSR